MDALNMLDISGVCLCSFIGVEQYMQYGPHV